MNLQAFCNHLPFRLALTGRIAKTALTVLLSVAAAHLARADFVTYTFEAPIFASGQATPLLNRAPNTGDPAFRANFTSSPTGNGFTIGVFSPNPLLTGQTIFDPGSAADTLTITFNQPIDTVEVDFAVREPGRLVLTTPVGSLSQNSANVGGNFEGGTLIFESVTPFTTMQFSAFSSAGPATVFALDDLRVYAVPEPSTVALLAMGACGVLFLARRKVRRRS